MSGFTPGAWAANGSRVEPESLEGWPNDGWIIADLHGPDATANARLIAAAPDLLAFAKLVAGLDEDAIEVRVGGEPVGSLSGLITAARAAITKALPTNTAGEGS